MWNFVSNDKQPHSARRGGGHPAPTITGGHDSNNRVWFWTEEEEDDMLAVKAMGAGMVERYGDRPSRRASEPSFTIRGSAGGMEPGGFRWQPESDDDMTWGLRDRPAPTVTGGGGKASGIEIFDQQSRHKMLAKIQEGTMNGNDRPVNPNTPLDPIRVTVEEAAILQSYEQEFLWSAPMLDGEGQPIVNKAGVQKTVPKTKQYLIVGNAVPPLIAQVTLDAIWSMDAPLVVSAADLELAA